MFGAFARYQISVECFLENILFLKDQGMQLYKGPNPAGPPNTQYNTQEQLLC